MSRAGAALTPLLLAFTLPAAAGPPPSASHVAVVRHAQIIAGRLTVDDYPRSARLGPAGTTRLHLVVGTGGRVEQCIVVESSGTSALDAQSCRIVRRWTFRPARDRSGHAVVDTLAASFVWSPPDDIRLDGPRPLGD